MLKYQHEASVFNVSLKRFGQNRIKVSAQLKHGEKIHKIKLGLTTTTDHLQLINSESVEFLTNRLSDGVRWVPAKITQIIPITDMLLELAHTHLDKSGPPLPIAGTSKAPAVNANERTKKTASKTTTPSKKAQAKKIQKGRKGKDTPRNGPPKSMF